MQPKIHSFQRIVLFTRQVGVLRKVSLFESLPQEVVSDLARRTTVRRFAAGEVMASQNDRATELGIMLEGQAKVTLVGENQREVTIETLSEGGIFGDVSILDGQSHSATIVALTEATAMFLERQAFFDHLQAYPQTAMRLLKAMAQRIRRSEQMIGGLALHDVSERLLQTLLTLAQEKGESTADGIAIRRRPTQQDLANMVGTCRETVSRALSSMARRGLVVSRGRTLVLRPAVIEQYAKAA